MPRLLQWYLLDLLDLYSQSCHLDLLHLYLQSSRLGLSNRWCPQSLSVLLFQRPQLVLLDLLSQGLPLDPLDL